MVGQRRRRWTNIDTILDEVLCLLGCIQVPNTMGVDPMLGQCWAIVYDAGPTLDQHVFHIPVTCGHHEWRWRTPANRRQQANLLETSSSS